MKKLLQYPLVLLFSAFLILFSITDMIISRREFSEMENKFLQLRPQFNIPDLMSKKFATKYETYINDQFVFRDQWISLKSRAEYAIGKRENNGVIYGSNDYLFGRYDEVNTERLTANVGEVNRFFERYSEIPATLGVIPNAYAVLSEKLPYGVELYDQYAAIERIYEALPGQANALSLREPLENANDSYLYYRTDHHWTTQGAYLAYSAFVRSKGMEPVKLDSLPKTEVPDFYGTLYSKAKRHNAVPDIITYYDIPVEDVLIDGKRTVLDAQKQEISVDGLYNRAQFEKRDKYAAFLYGNNGVTVLKSGVNRYPKPGGTSRILLVKDSYSNSLAPFFLYHFDEVVVVDLRAFGGKMSELMAQYEFDEILLLYNFENFAQDINFVRLKY